MLAVFSASVACSCLQSHSLTEKQQKIADKIRKREARITNLQRELDKIKARALLVGRRPHAEENKAPHVSCKDCSHAALAPVHICMVETGTSWAILFP